MFWGVGPRAQPAAREAAIRRVSWQDTPENITWLATSVEKLGFGFFLFNFKQLSSLLSVASTVHRSC